VASSETTPEHAEVLVPSDWEPRIVGFLCNWCSYAGADLAGTSRVAYPCNMRIIRVPCSGRVDPLMILRAFREGADGVLVFVPYGYDPDGISVTAESAAGREQVGRRVVEEDGVHIPYSADRTRIHIEWP
jgi:coenzyme F420-reducing hydrogenase delta subunit